MDSTALNTIIATLQTSQNEWQNSQRQLQNQWLKEQRQLQNQWQNEQRQFQSKWQKEQRQWRQQQRQWHQRVILLLQDKYSKRQVLKRFNKAAFRKVQSDVGEGSAESQKRKNSEEKLEKLEIRNEPLEEEQGKEESVEQREPLGKTALKQNFLFESKYENQLHLQSAFDYHIPISSSHSSQGNESRK